MAGRGGTFVEAADGSVRAGMGFDGILPPMCRPCPSQILSFTAESRWEDATEPLHRGIDCSKECGVGPGLAFANELRSRGWGSRIGLVPCAVGGTCIDEWSEDSELYRNSISRLSEALQQLPQARLCGLLWYQGESDSDTEERATSYACKIKSLFSRYRARVAVPDLPIVQVAIHTTRKSLPYLGKIREVQLQLDLPNLVTVDAAPYHLPDELHLSTPAQAKLGRDIAEAFLTS
eukprot:CAMPEP_0117687050 /NCGR_PEP_ID=MMETSP0804-20121206/22889_1 /TAXON_ID=1074897 /ORGANISM="Tetraselmis astigmatica, Strain CCMP880" /LENGTH=233 /DNA_ID=CAMNT_0005499009 /DNA_START=61 /DNA_END=759 /DNA_ORIENTATION=+